jgi:hypothetical protein
LQAKLNLRTRTQTAFYSAFDHSRERRGRPRLWDFRAARRAGSCWSANGPRMLRVLSAFGSAAIRPPRNASASSRVSNRARIVQRLTVDDDEGSWRSTSSSMSFTCRLRRLRTSAPRRAPKQGRERRRSYLRSSQPHARKGDDTNIGALHGLQSLHHHDDTKYDAVSLAGTQNRSCRNAVLFPVVISIARSTDSPCGDGHER